MFAGNFAPRGWAFCDGQLLPISTNSALFSILGTTYGGDGRTTFALPDMRGRVSVHPGTGSGLTRRTLGQMFGSEDVALNHIVGGTATAEAQSVPQPGILDAIIRLFTNGGDDTCLTTTECPAPPPPPLNSPPSPPPLPANVLSVDVSDLTIEHESSSNVQPSLAVNHIIALQGIFPSRS